MFIERRRHGLKIIAQPVDLSGELVEARSDAHHVFSEGADLAAIKGLLVAHSLHVSAQGLQVVKRNAFRLIGHI